MMQGDMDPNMKTPLRIAINGLGRIGRMFIRIAWDNPALEIVGANSSSDISAYAHLLKYDSLYGTWNKEVSCDKDAIYIDGKKIPVFQVTDKEKLPWGALSPDIVLEASGKYRARADAAMHVKAGAKRVLVTAPMDDADITLVDGINSDQFDPSLHTIISAASCTSVCSSLVLDVLLKQFGIARGFITTVHAVTGDQNLNDGAHKDLRRARAATESIIPTSTGVTRTVGMLFPPLAGKVSGISLRVPITVPSIISMNVDLEKDATPEELNAAFSAAAAGPLKGHLGVSNLPLVSVDFKQNAHGSIVDLLETAVVDKRLANILSWYDNEWGYTSQVALLLQHMGSVING
jgi:glyceraldehyde 3-phosphate dehydrogenase